MTSHYVWKSGRGSEVYNVDGRLGGAVSVSFSTPLDMSLIVIYKFWYEQ